MVHAISVEQTYPDIRQNPDRRARWGIVLQIIAYSLLWQTH